MAADPPNDSRLEPSHGADQHAEALISRILGAGKAGVLTAHDVEQLAQMLESESDGRGAAEALTALAPQYLWAEDALVAALRSAKIGPRIRCMDAFNTSTFPTRRILSALAASLGGGELGLRRALAHVLYGTSPDSLGGQRRSSRDQVPETERTVLAYLNLLRSKSRIGETSGEKIVEMRPELCAGAQAHARYLELHPEQYGRAEFGHAEYPEEGGYSAAGSTAGANSLIAFNGSAVDEAIDIFMATVYHRVALLAPTVAIGWGTAEGIVVLDCRSAAVKDLGAQLAVWPGPDVEDVPLRFCAHGEDPSPMQSVQRALLGFPVSVQTGPGEALGLRSLRLYETRADAPEVLVQCTLVLSNRSLATAVACGEFAALLPGRPLKPSTTYRVEFVRNQESESVKWSFRTLAPERDLASIAALAFSSDRAECEVGAVLLNSLGEEHRNAAAELRRYAQVSGVAANIQRCYYGAAVRVRGGRPEIWGKTIDYWASRVEADVLDENTIIALEAIAQAGVCRAARAEEGLAETPDAREAIRCLALWIDKSRGMERIWALRAAGRLGSGMGPAKNAVVRVMRTGFGDEVEEALGAIAQAGELGPEAMSALVETFASPNAGIRLAAADAAARLGVLEAKAVAVVVDALRGPSKATVYTGLRVVMRLGRWGLGAADELRSLVRGSNPEIARRAMLALRMAARSK